MPRVPSFLRQIFFLLSAFCLALFLQFRSQLPSFTFSRHRFLPEGGRLAISTVLLFLLVNGVWALCSQLLVRSFRIKYKEALAADFETYLPIVVFALTPLSLSHFLTFDDLEARLGLFLAAGLFSVLYLKAVRGVALIREKRPPWLRAARDFHGLPLRQKILILFILSVLIYSAGTLVMMSKGISFSGDEPHYLLITRSLLKDGDFDLANNYAEQDYSEYMIPQATVRAHTVPGRKPGSQYSFHSPGIALLLLPFYAVGSFFGRGGLPFILRFGMSLIGALLGVQVYLYALQEWKKEGLALGLWFLASFTSPIFFYSIHVYPEIAVALFSFTVFRLLRFSPTFSNRRLLLCGLLLFSFIWFHALKYLFILGPLLLYGLWVLLKKHRVGARLAYFLAFPVVVTALYFCFQLVLYGSLNPTSVSWQGAMSGQETVTFVKSLLTGIPFRFRLETLLGYFLDQRDGLFFYAPIYIFTLLGLIEMLRRKPREALTLLFITAPYVLVSALLTQRTGYAPQARPLVAVMWGPAILVGDFLAHNGKRIFAYLMNLSIGLSLLVVWLLCQNPLALYQETTVGTTERGGSLFYELSNLHYYLTNLLPSFIKIEDWRWTPNFVWPLALALLVAAYVLVRKHEFRLRFGHHLVLAGLGLVLFFAWFVFYPRITLVPPRKVTLASGEKLTFYAISRVALIKEDGDFALLEDNRDYHFYFATGRPIDKLRVKYGSPFGDYELRLGFFDGPVFQTTTSRELKTWVVDSPPAYKWNGSDLYRITIHLEKRSDVRTGVNPYTLGFQPVH